MPEYIEREAAEKELMYAMVGTGYQSRAIDAIKFVPTADVVEVVRCKDCKYWNNGDCYRLELSMPNDFCSYGQRWTERRQNDEHIR